MRGRPKLQHLKVSAAVGVKLIRLAFSKHPNDAKLYPLSPAAYLDRWDKLLALLSVPKEAKLTPGGLRGGGAVQCYGDGIPISEIQFRMRLKIAHTL